MTWSRSHWYIVYPAGLLFASILYGLLAGISVFAYRALAAEPTPETPL
jgi:hypothetical protein